MALFVKVQGPKAVQQFPLEDSSVLGLPVLQAQYPTATDLLYSDGTTKVVVTALEGVVRPPTDGWADRIYSVLPEPALSNPVDATMADIQLKLINLLQKPQQNLVMAPELKIATFDGKASEVQDFVKGIE